MFCLCLVLMRFCYKQFSQRQAVEDFKEQKEIQQKIENETNKQVLQIAALLHEKQLDINELHRLHVP